MDCHCSGSSAPCVHTSNSVKGRLLLWELSTKQTRGFQYKLIPIQRASIIMSVRVVYSQSFGVKYKASVCSKAFILYVVITILTFTLPLLFCYRSSGRLNTIFTSIIATKYYFLLLFSGLWMKYEKYREQPMVQFKLQYLLYAETSDPMSPLICGNYPRTLKTTGLCSTIKVYLLEYYI